MNLKCHPMLAALGCFILFLGCGYLTGKPKTAEYSSSGKIVTQLYTETRTDCDNGTIDATTCKQLRKLYNEIRECFMHAGDLIIQALDENNVVKREVLIVRYNNTMKELSADIAEFIRKRGQAYEREKHE